MIKTKYQILDLMQKFNIPYAAKGKSFVCRCPFCKGDGKLQNHNAEINPESGTIYCFSEQKTYFAKDILLLFGELNNETIEKAKEKIKRDAEHNTGLVKATREKRKFDDLKSDLLSKGYTIAGIYTYYNLSCQKEYEVIRFEKPRPDGKPEKIPIPVTPDGYVGLGNKRQIPYRLEQFSLILTDEIWLCEGEKCCDAVIANMPSSANIICLGFRKASNLKGFENLFQGKRVTIFEDNDKTGQTNTENLIEMLRSFAKEIVVVKFSEFQEGYDVADFLEDFSWNQLFERIFLSEKIEQKNIEIETQRNKKFLAENMGLGSFVSENWLCKNLIYSNSICLLDASGATGKSFLALQMAVSYILHDVFLLPEFQWNKKNRKVMYITTQLENPPEIVSNRLLQILYNFDQLDREIFVENFDIAYLDALFVPDPVKQLVIPTETFSGFSGLKKYIEEKQIELVIIDPIAQFFLCDLNSNEKVTAIYRELEKVSTTWILVHHQSKASQFEESENTSQRGASALRDNARLRLTMKKRAILHMGEIATDLFIEKANFSRYHQHHIFLTPKPPFSVISTTIWDHDEFMQRENEIKKGEKERKKGNGSNKKYQEEFA
jgi:RecA-family ATPase